MPEYAHVPIRMLAFIVWIALLPPLNALYYGVGCPACGDVTCPPVPTSCPLERRLLGGECGCCAVCGADVGDKCGGSTGVQCRQGLVCKNRLGMTLGEERVGLCEPRDCKYVVCCYRRACSYKPPSSGQLTCTCSHIHCQDKWNPVCGHNGVSYTSVCALQKEECKSRRFIGLDHLGLCQVSPYRRRPIPNPVTGERRDPFAAQLRYLRLSIWKELRQRASLHNQTESALKESAKNIDSAQYNDSTDSNSDSGDLPPSFYDHGEDTEVTLPLTPNNPFPECVHNGEMLEPGTMVQLETGNPCVYRKCDPLSGRLMEVAVPGCTGYPAEKDYNVTHIAVDGGWSNWTNLTCTNCSTGVECKYCSSYYSLRTCTDPAPSNEGRGCEGNSLEFP